MKLRETNWNMRYKEWILLESYEKKTTLLAKLEVISPYLIRCLHQTPHIWND